MITNSTYPLIQNIFHPKGLFGEDYKMVWFQKLPLSKGPNVSKNPFKRGFGKTKPIYKTLIP
jgi:hypothetical protein